ncbi:acyltransferase family protein [Rhizobium laguerreae]
MNKVDSPASVAATKLIVAEKRINEIDVIRATAIILVILLHSSSPVLYQIAVTPMAVWNVHNVVDSAARICVPLFFMVSGYLLLATTEATKASPLSDLPKRLLKLLLPLLLWSMIYRMGMIYVNGSWPTAHDIFSAFKDMLQGAVVYHLWFLYELAALYLLLPFLRPLFQQTDISARYFVCLWFTLLTARLLSSLAGWGFPFGNYINLGAAGYLVAGYVIRRNCATPSAQIATIAFVAYLIMTIATFYLTKIYSVSTDTYVEQFHVYTTPNVVIMSVSAFIFLLRASEWISRFPRLSAAVSLIGVHSFGVYLVHVIVLERISYNVLGTPAATPFGAVSRIIATSGFVLVVSFIIAWCLRRFRVTRWMAP